MPRSDSLKPSGRHEPEAPNAALGDLTAPCDLSGLLIDGRYRLLERIATGGMGSVYRGRHELMKREVAVKVLETRILDSPQQVEGFKREIDAISELDHPNIVQIYDAGFDPSVGHYAAMRMLRGSDVARRILNGPPLSILQILTIAEQTCLALAAIHAKGIIHRDVKSENIFLAEDSHQAVGFSVRLLDFGVSMVVTSVANRGGGRAASVAGTPYTMSPEQIRGRQLDLRTDIYSFGILLFELFTGGYPFAPDSVNDLLRMQVLVPAPRASSTDGGKWIPPELDSLLDAMLSKDRELRPPSMDAVRAELQELRPAVTSAWAAHFMGRERELGRAMVAPANSQMFRTLQLINTEAILETDVVPPALPPRRRTSASTPPMRRVSDIHPAVAQSGSFKVAIVDDEPAIRMLLQMVCERAGCQHVSFERGEAVLAAYRDGDRFDAVVLDLLMPGIDGLETLRELRKGGYAGPVIVCSTLESADVRQRVSDYSDVVFMDKVIDFNRMRDLLGHWLSIREQSPK